MNILSRLWKWLREPEHLAEGKPELTLAEQRRTRYGADIQERNSWRRRDDSGLGLPQSPTWTPPHSNDYSGHGGTFGGAGASGSWDGGSSCDSGSSDSGSSDSGCSGGSD